MVRKIVHQYHINTASFTWGSKIIEDICGFAPLQCLIDPKSSRHLLNQSDSKLKPTAAWLLLFSCASSSLLVYTSSFHRLLETLLLFLIDYFGFCALKHKDLKQTRQNMCLKRTDLEELAETLTKQEPLLWEKPNIVLYREVKEASGRNDFNISRNHHIPSLIVLIRSPGGFVAKSCPGRQTWSR